MRRSDGFAAFAPVEPRGSVAPSSHPGLVFFISVGLARLWTLSSKFWPSRLSVLEAVAGGLDTTMAGSEVLFRHIFMGVSEKDSPPNTRVPAGVSAAQDV